MEQVRNRAKIRLIADPDTALKAVSSITFRQSEIVNPDLVMIRGARTRVELNKLIAVGFCILEISKLIMYRFYYEVLKEKYADRCTLLFTDTDSFCCEIGTRDLYEDFEEMLDELDTSNFDASLPQFRRTTVGCWVSSRAKRARWLRKNSSNFGQRCTVYTCPEIRGNG